MRTFATLAILVTVASTGWAEKIRHPGVRTAQYIQCGLPPIPPLGCHGTPQCVCGGGINPRCQWVFNCGP